MIVFLGLGCENLQHSTAEAMEIVLGGARLTIP